jgi:phosphoribosyl 1,2-cyclic phosphodiesterase
MKTTFWGVRGLIPSPGREFNAYGGNTACVSIESRDTLIILDAGTGIIPLGHSLMSGAYGRGCGRATLLLSHAHWDHIQGFPFFAPVYIEGNHFEIFGPGESSSMLAGILEGQMNPHFSPVQSLKNLGATTEIRAVEFDSSISCGPLRVRAVSNPHGSVSALAYRIDDTQSGRSVVYAPDAGYGADLPPASAALYRGADYLIHDCTYTPEDQAERRERGYSSIADAARVAATCGVRALVMFHYDQDYTDREVDRLQHRCRQLLDGHTNGAAINLIAAREGMTLE